MGRYINLKCCTSYNKMASIPHDITKNTSRSKASPYDAGGHSTAPPAQQGIEQPTFNILPHPAVCRSNYKNKPSRSLPTNQKSNDPADLQKPSENTGGLRSSQSAFQAAPGPVMLNQQMLNNLGPAKVCSSKSQYTRCCSTI